MELNRRDFLKLGGAGLGGLGGLTLLGLPAPQVAASVSAKNPQDTENGVLYDVSKCVGCRACQNACKSWNGNPPDPNGFDNIYDNPLQLSAKTFTLIKAKEFEFNGQKRLFFTKFQCMHCNIPACANACLVTALIKTAEGPVIYDKKRCVGCRYCMAACPFGVPTYEWDTPIPWVRKCTFCADRQSQGLIPACVNACPAGALKFGKRTDLIAEAKQRIAADPVNYVNHVYGEKELGGTSWMYLSPVPFAQLGLPDLGEKPVTVNVERAMNLVLPVLGGVALTMTGIYAAVQGRAKRMLKKKEKQ